MEKLTYETSKEGRCITPCPNNILSLFGGIILVGSDSCYHCEYNYGVDTNLRFVKCGFKK